MTDDITAAFRAAAEQAVDNLHRTPDTTSTTANASKFADYINAHFDAQADNFLI